MNNNKRITMFIAITKRLLCPALIMFSIVSCTTEQTSPPLILTRDSGGIITPTNISIPRETPSEFTESISTSTSVNNTIIPTITATPYFDLEATVTPTSTKAPVLQINDSKNYMLLLSNSLLWHPDMVGIIQEPLRDMSFGRMPWSPDGGKIATRLLTHNGLAILTVENGEISFLDGTATDSDAPFWSPNGRYLTYVTETIANRASPSIAFYDLEMGKAEFETEPIDLIRLVGWSFDSSKIAYFRWGQSENTDDYTPVLEVFDLSTHQTQMYQNSSDSTLWVDASWSPNKNELVVLGIDPDMGIPEPSFHIYSFYSIDLLDIDTGYIEVLKQGGTSTNEESDRKPLYTNAQPWSPDGTRIIYSNDGLICYLDISSKDELCPDAINSAITKTGAIGGRYPSFSVEENWIGFILSFPDQHGGPIAAIRSDGSDLRFTDIDAGEITLFGPIWSPSE